MGTRQKAWGAAHTLDSGPPARLRPVLPPRGLHGPLPAYFVCFFFSWKKTEFILNIIYLCI